MGMIAAALVKLFGIRKRGNPSPTLERTNGEQRKGLPHGEQRPRKPLRVVHSGPGRIVISGRMADVCAELDRLAAMEARGAQAFAPAR